MRIYRLKSSNNKKINFERKFLLKFMKFLTEKKLYRNIEKYKNALFAIVKGAERTYYVCC